MECKFVVGQKVVCVDERWVLMGSEAPPEVGCPKLNEICTVFGFTTYFGLVGLRLKEFRTGYSYLHSSFRPLQDRPKEADTDISVFTPALNVKKLEPVP